MAAYLGTMGMELNPRKCAMATTKGVPGLQLHLCPHLENPWHWVPAADSPTWDFSCSQTGSYHCSANTACAWRRCNTGASTPFAPRKAVQDVILAILGGVTQYVASFIADDSDTARHLDHITVQVARDRA